MIILEKYGRFGNNIHQIIKVVYKNITELKHEKINISFINFYYKNFFKNLPDEIIFSEFLDNSNNKLLIKNNFWNVSVPTDMRYYIIKKYIKPYINNDIDFKKLYNINFDTDLIIHVRSGDIFDKNKSAWKKYIQPPLCFYKKVIDNNKFEKIYILTEKKNPNPIISKLKSLYKNLIVFDNNSLEIDFKIMINSKYFVHANSTLSNIITYMSLNKQTVYLNGWTDGGKHNGNNVIHYNTLEYYKNDYETLDQVINKMIIYDKL